MNKKRKARLYYMYMMTDGNVTDAQMKIFHSICKELGLDAQQERDVIQDCQNMINKQGKNCIQLLQEGTGNDENYVLMYVTDNTPFIYLDGYMEEEEKANVLWNLIHLGYADTHYTSNEQEVVDFVRKHWNLPKDLYLEMIDIAETDLALQEYQQWVQGLPESTQKTEKTKQVQKDIQYNQQSIKRTLSEINF